MQLSMLSQVCIMWECIPVFDVYESDEYYRLIFKNDKIKWNSPCTNTPYQ